MWDQSGEMRLEAIAEGVKRRKHSRGKMRRTWRWQQTGMTGDLDERTVNGLRGIGRQHAEEEEMGSLLLKMMHRD